MGVNEEEILLQQTGVQLYSLDIQICTVNVESTSTMAQTVTCTEGLKALCNQNKMAALKNEMQ